jgi:hypothetical protein
MISGGLGLIEQAVIARSAATKQSRPFAWLLDCFASLAMTWRLADILPASQAIQRALFFAETARYYHCGFAAT